jgi:hypothetical protein
VEDDSDEDVDEEGFDEQSDEEYADSCTAGVTSHFVIGKIRDETVKFFNEAPSEDIEALVGCCAKFAEIIVSKRPFQSFDELVTNSFE